jgi:ABC-type multidrug transport system fused ATPase/permease subunit
VAENIGLGDPTATLDQLRVAAALADADRFVRSLPDGYETVVGDGGRPLSPGQVRRIALARAFLREAPLLVLDEPTADLDPESAAIVGDAIDRCLGRCTLLLITHREGLARRCDRVVRLEGGHLSEAVVEAVA